MVKYTEFFWAWTNKEKIYQGRFNGKIGKQKKTNKQTWNTTNIQDKNQQPKWNSTENKQIGCFGLQNLTVLKFKELRARICRCMRNYYKQSMVFCFLIDSDWNLSARKFAAIYLHLHYISVYEIIKHL